MPLIIMLDNALDRMYSSNMTVQLSQEDLTMNGSILFATVLIECALGLLFYRPAPLVLHKKRRTP